TQEDGDVLADEMPVVSGSQALIDILTQSNLASSNAEAKRLIEAGSISVNGQKMITNEVIQANSLLKKGKNSFVLIR
ncbi:tyrosine--tRNA ligase, partial [Candidatus Saccharibacteria bacterium]|nr:tyrosine--tRNA ligase [Candidatus Saccharibacteria bacterium]